MTYVYWPANAGFTTIGITRSTSVVSLNNNIFLRNFMFFFFYAKRTIFLRSNR